VVLLQALARGWRTARGLLELDGIPLIQRQLMALQGRVVEQVVVGHHAARIQPVMSDFVTLVCN
jgi:molybdenum cofactor cytidylyltransferase